MIEYVECAESDIPADVRFDTPRQNQGQIVTESYGGPASERDEHDYGDPWCRRHDASDGSTKYYRRVYR